MSVVREATATHNTEAALYCYIAKSRVTVQKTPFSITTTKLTIYTKASCQGTRGKICAKDSYKITFFFLVQAIRSLLSKLHGFQGWATIGERDECITSSPWYLIHNPIIHGLYNGWIPIQVCIGSWFLHCLEICIWTPSWKETNFFFFDKRKETNLKPAQGSKEHFKYATLVQTTRNV